MANNTDLISEIDQSEELIEHAAFTLRELDRDDIAHTLDNIADTLQRARDAITKAQGELVQLSESTDSMGHPVFARQLMDIHDILSAYTPEEK